MGRLRSFIIFLIRLAIIWAVDALFLMLMAEWVGGFTLEAGRSGSSFGADSVQRGREIVEVRVRIRARSGRARAVGGPRRGPFNRDLAFSRVDLLGSILDFLRSMDWPTDPVESQTRFLPPFCPRRSCSENRRSSPGYRIVRYGSYSTRRRRHIPRFRCQTCRHTFSRQTFATSYYLKRPALTAPIAAGIVAGSAHRQIARSLACAPTTVAGQAARLGRHAILLLARALDRLEGRVDEPFVLDHFETFEFTQDWPFGVATPVGAESWFVYGLDPVPHARTGKRTPSQRKRIATRPRRPRHGGYVEGVLSDGRGGIKKTSNLKDPYSRRTHTVDDATYWVAYEAPVRYENPRGRGNRDEFARKNAPGYGFARK